MNARLKQLRDLVVALDRADRNQEAMSADAYRAAAEKALKLTREQMGLLPIGDFAGPVNALQSMAENIFFSLNGCFADLDGSGGAPLAKTAARELLMRLHSVDAGAGTEIADSLFARLRFTSAAPARARPRARPRVRPARA